MPLHQSSTQVIGKGNEQKIGSYFRRNYEEGIPLQIPSNNKGSWNEWKAGKLRKLEYYDSNDMRKDPFDDPGKRPPRIYLRGDAQQTQYDWKDKLDPHHFEFRRETEKEQAMKTWDELTDELIDKFCKDLFQLSSINDGYASREPRHLLLIWKYEARSRRDYRGIADDSWIYPDLSTIINPVWSDSYDLLEKICREIISRSHVKIFLKKI